MKIVTDHNQISSQIRTYFHHRKGLENKRSGTDDQCQLHRKWQDLHMSMPSPLQVSTHFKQILTHFLGT